MRKALAFKSWMETKGISMQDVAAMCERKGWPTSPEYIKNIANGYRRPGWDFAVFLSNEITGGVITVEQFRNSVRKSRAA